MGTDILGDLADPAAAELFMLSGAQIVRIAHDAAFTSAQRDIDHRAFPRHPHREGTNDIDIFHRMETDSPFAGAARIVMLNPEPPEYPDLAVVHANGDAEMVFPQRITEQVPGRLVQIEKISHSVELSLGYFKWIVRFISHHIPPSDSRFIF